MIGQSLNTIEPQAQFYSHLHDVRAWNITTLIATEELEAKNGRGTTQDLHDEFALL